MDFEEPTPRKPRSAFKLTAKQVAANDLLSGSQRHTMLYGGGRSGKTFLLCRAIAVRAMRAPGSRHAIMRLRFNHCKTSIGFDTFPKMMALCFPDVKAELSRTDWFFKFPNGSEVWLGGMDEKERAEKILGQEYATIYINECSQIKSFAVVELVQTRLAQKTSLVNRMYYDCNPSGFSHWTYALFVSKVHPEQRQKPLGNADNYRSIIMNPQDNAENLDDEYIASFDDMSDAKRRRFRDGQFVVEFDNALWTSEIIDSTRVSGKIDADGNLADVPDLRRIIIGVDPSGAKGPEDKRSDETGIVVAGSGVDGRHYVLKDYSLRAHPTKWGQEVVNAYHRHGADLIIAENNFGGAMVESTIRQIDSSVTVISRNAGSRGKVVRAEPIAAMWAPTVKNPGGLASIVGTDMAALEDQMNEMTTAGFAGAKSPDRVDAMVWALTELYLTTNNRSAFRVY